MRALAHPVRMALLELLGAAGTVTATQASEVLGESERTLAIARERHHHDPGPRGPRYRFHWSRGL